MNKEINLIEALNVLEKEKISVKSHYLRRLKVI